MTDNSTGLKMLISLILELKRQHGDGDHLQGPCVHNEQYDQKNSRKNALTLTSNYKIFNLFNLIITYIPAFFLIWTK